MPRTRETPLRRSASGGSSSATSSRSTGNDRPPTYPPSADPALRAASAGLPLSMDRDPDGAGARGELHRVRDARVRPERDRRAEVAGLRVDPRDRAIVVRRPDRTLTDCDV